MKHLIAAFLKGVFPALLLLQVLGACDDDTVTPGSTPFAEKLQTLRWICYAPTHYDPLRDPAVLPSEEDMREDLRVLRSQFNGIITYGLNQGLDRVPMIALEEGFLGVIAGIWDVRNEIEIVLAEQLAQKGLIDAVCVGNEGLMTNRYTWEQLDTTLARLRSSTGLPLTTTEALHMYGDSRMMNTDFLLPNIHPVWNGESTPEGAAGWVDQQARALTAVSKGKPLLIKETGFPSASPWSEELQSEFYHKLTGLQAGVTNKVYAFAYFEAYDQPWKRELLDGHQIGDAWGLYTSRREPKLVVRALPELSGECVSPSTAGE